MATTYLPAEDIDAASSLEFRNQTQPMLDALEQTASAPPPEPAPTLPPLSAYSFGGENPGSAQDSTYGPFDPAGYGQGAPEGPPAPAPALPPLEAYTSAWTPPTPAPSEQPTPDPGLSSPGAQPAEVGEPSAPVPAAGAEAQRGGDLVAYARGAAQRNGIDPDVFVRQINQESGFDPNAGSPAGARGIAQIVPRFHPGVDVTDPYASLDYAAKLMRSHLDTYGGDIRKALQAYNAGPAAVASGAADRIAETKDYLAKILGEGGQAIAQAPAAIGQAVQSLLGRKPPESTPASAQPVSEVDQATLDDPDKWALCGPVAAVLAAAAHGKNWTVAEAKGIASRLGLWNADRGMGGLGTEVQLLQQAGISATAGAADEQRLIQDATSGNTPIISTEGHYYVLQGYDPATGKFDTGKTGTVYRGGSRWLSLADMQRLSGAIQGAAFMDNPASPAPSVAAEPDISRQNTTSDTTFPDIGSTQQVIAPTDPLSSAMQDIGSTLNRGRQKLGEVFPVLGQSDPLQPHHDGDPGAVDVFAPRGAPVVATQAGKVLFAGRDKDGGNVVVTASKDGQRQYYAHLDGTPLVQTGDIIPAGQPLGNVGNTGNAEGKDTQLHYGEGDALDTQGNGVNGDVLASLQAGKAAALPAAQAFEPGPRDVRSGVVEDSASGPYDQPGYRGQPGDFPEVPPAEITHYPTGPRPGDFPETPPAAPSYYPGSEPVLGPTEPPLLGPARPEDNRGLPGQISDAAGRLARGELRPALEQKLGELGQQINQQAGATPEEAAARDAVLARTEASDLPEAAKIALRGMQSADDMVNYLSKLLGSAVYQPIRDTVIKPILAAVGAEHHVDVPLLGEQGTADVVASAIPVLGSLGGLANARGMGRLIAPSETLIGRGVQAAADTGLVRRAGEALGTLRDTATAMTRGLPGGAPVARVVEQAEPIAAQRLVAPAVGGGIAGGYEAAQEEGATPGSVARGAALGAAGGAARGALTRRGGGQMVARAVEQAGEELPPERPPIYGPRGETLSPAAPRETPAAARERILDERGKPITLSTPEEIARLRLDKFPEQIRGELEAAATDVDFGRAQRRGVIPDDVANELANTYRQSADRWIREGRAGRSYNEEQTLALRNLSASTAVRIHELTLDIDAARAAGTTPDLLIAQRAAESNKLNGLIQVAEGARAEAGRSFRAWQMDARALNENPQAAIQRIYKKIGDRAEAERIAAEYSQAITEGGDPFALANIWAKVERGEIKTGERFALYRRFNMLSGPRTLEVNATSGLINMVGEDLAAAGGSLLRGDPRGAAIQVAAPWLGIQRAARGFAQTLAHGITEEQALRGDVPRNLSSRATNRLDRAQLTIQELPDRFNSAVDQFWRGTAESLGLATHAVERTRKLKGDARVEAIGKILADPDKAAADAAERMANRVTFQGDLGATGRALQRVQEVPFVGNLVMPFLRTVYHITTRSIDLSPLGAATTAQEVVRSLPGISRVGQGAYAAGKELPKGVPELSKRVRDNVAGTLIFAWAYDQARQGNITGAGPDDPEKRDELRATGWRPYSVKIGDSYHSYANVAPLTVALSMGAAAHEAQKYGKPGQSVADTFADGAARTMKVVGDMSVVSGIGSLVKAQQDPERYGLQFITQYLQTFIPAGSAVSTVGQATDPLERRSLPGADAGTKLTEGLKARVPGLREQVPPATNPLGQPIESQQTGFGALQPTRPSKEQDAPIIRAFLDAGVDIGSPPKKFTLDGNDVALSPQEQRRYQEIRGSYLERFAPRVIDRPAWATWKPETRTAALKGLLDDMNQAAQGQMLREIGAAEIRKRVVGERQRKAS